MNRKMQDFVTIFKNLKQSVLVIEASTNIARLVEPTAHEWMVIFNHFMVDNNNGFNVFSTNVVVGYFSFRDKRYILELVYFISRN